MSAEQETSRIGAGGTIVVRTLHDSDQVLAAPGRGIEPAISAHMATTPSLYNLDSQPVEQVSPLIQRQHLHGINSTFVKWTLKRGASLPVHHHSYEQTTWIVEGECELFSQGTKYVVRAGDILIIPPNVPHEVLFTQDSINIDFFAPARQDWMDGTATYYKTAPEP